MALLALLAVAGGVWWFVGPRAGRTTSAPLPTCSSTRQTAHVVVTPALATVAARAAARVAQRSPCVALELTTAESAAVAASFLGESTLPDAWLSDSSLWPATVRAARPDRLSAQSLTIAVSPMVLAVPDVVVTTVRADVTATTWASVLRGGSRLPITLPDPQTTTSSRLLLLTSAPAVEAGAGRARLTGDLMAWSHSTMRAPVDLFADLSSAAPRVFPTSEQSVASFRESHPGLVTAVVPSGGTPAFDYTLTTSAGAAPDASAAVTALRAELTGPQTATELAASGFRPDLSSDGSGVSGVTAAAISYSPLPAPATQVSTLQAWQAARTDSRMLALLDTSASMGEQVGSTTRIALVTGAARRAVGLLPDSAELGTWEFGEDKGGPGIHWSELTPIERLDTFHAGQPHRQAAVDVLGPLPARVTGGTALYDSVLAAVQTMRSSYDPERINSIVVLTDGRNDTPDGLTLEQLLARLTQLRDPSRPVLVVTIGMGPDADVDALRAISAATGARSYVARDPADIDAVFLDAILSRTCSSTGCTG